MHKWYDTALFGAISKQSNLYELYFDRKLSPLEDFFIRPFQDVPLHLLLLWPIWYYYKAQKRFRETTKNDKWESTQVKLLAFSATLEQFSTRVANHNNKEMNN